MGGTLRPDDRISRYRIVRPIGAGGMGEVYAARDTSLDRNVALKVLPERLVENEQRVSRFVREAKSASSLSHPNIVTIYEIGHDKVTSEGSTDAPSVHFISMELVEGDTLAHKIHESRDDLRTLVGIIAQAADGVAKAHAAGIVHRDLKPSNIMVTRDGFAKVLDFGLAKLTERGSDAGGMTSAPTVGPDTGEGVVLGTVGYMAPEQVQGKPADHRADIFALGCILYEAATRRRPFSAETDVEIMHQILRDPPPPVESLNPNVPAELRRIIRRCLAKSPDQRFQSMKDIAIDLRELVDSWDSLPTSGSTTGVMAPVTAGDAPRSKRRVGVAIAAVLGVAVVAAGVFFGLLPRRGSTAGESTGDITVKTLMSRDDLNEAVLSADGRYLAYITSDGERMALAVRQVRTGSDVSILPPQDYRINGISFSPEGDYLYFLNSDPKLPDYRAAFRVASLGGTPEKVAFDVDTAVTFSPDASRICFRRGMPSESADSLVVTEIPGGGERTLIRVQAPESLASPYGAGTPAWSPDGRRIAATIFNASGGVRTSVAVVDVENGKRVDLPHTWLFINGLGWLPNGSALIVSASDSVTGRSQIYRISYPEGDVTRITTDLDGYEGASVSSDGKLIAATRRRAIDNVWIAPVAPVRDARPLSFATGTANSVDFVAPLRDGGIAFTAPEGEHFFVWRMEADGGGRKRLTSKGVHVVNLYLAGNAGMMFTQVETNTKLHVWRMEADGSGLRQLTDGPGEQLIAVSPDGGSFLFEKLGDVNTVWRQSVAGGEAKPFLENVASTVEYSSDGRRLLYTGFTKQDGHIYPEQHVIPAEGGQALATFLLPPGAADVGLSPDGEAVTYVDRASHFNLMRRSIGKDEPQPLTRFTEGRILGGHKWSPDGRKILILRRVGPQDSLWILEPGKTPSKLIDFKTGRIDKYAWTEDSKSVVFTYGTLSQDVVLISGFR